MKLRKLKPTNDFEAIFQSITQGKMTDDGKFYLSTKEELTADLVEKLNISVAQKQLLKLLTD